MGSRVAAADDWPVRQRADQEKDDEDTGTDPGNELGEVTRLLLADATASVGPCSTFAPITFLAGGKTDDYMAAPTHSRE